MLLIFFIVNVVIKLFIVPNDLDVKVKMVMVLAAIVIVSIIYIYIPTCIIAVPYNNKCLIMIHRGKHEDHNIILSSS